MANRGYDVDHRADESIDMARRWIPSTHLIVPRSELLRIADVAKAAGSAEQAKRTYPDMRSAYANGRAAGIDLSIRALRYRWLFVAGIAVTSFILGRQSILWQAGL